MAEESKSDKFKRISGRRVDELVKKIKLVGNLSNRGSYEYDDADVERMFSRLQQVLDDAKERFNKPRRKRKDG